MGAGTGAYSFYYAEKGNEVIATDLSQYESESFDVVICLGPMYHLTAENDRVKCIQEALRVLKPGGILAIAYINKHYIIHVVMAHLKQFFTHTFIDEMLSSGVTKEGEKKCFLTVGFFTSPTEIELFIRNFNVEIIDHAATDGICSLLRNQINELNGEQYESWMNYMLSSCREKSMLGISNHGLLLCRKK